jgi:hypothetical protein
MSDGKSNVLFRNGTTGDLYEWNMNGATVTSNSGYVSVSPGLASAAGQPGKLVAQADFTGDGKADLLFEHPTSKALTMWIMNGTTVSASNTVSISPARSATEVFAGVGDFDGNGVADILMIDPHTSTTALSARILFVTCAGGQHACPTVGTTTTTSTAISTTIPQTAAQYGTHTGWHVAAIADFNGDGTADILWRFSTQTAAGGWAAGQTSLWFMNGATRLGGGALPAQLGKFHTTTPTGWLVVGTGDFNGDGFTDILYRFGGPSTTAIGAGQTAIWLMQGTTGTAPTLTPVKMATGSNTDNDWSLRGTGQTVDSSGTVLNPGAFTPTTGWTVDGVGDFYGATTFTDNVTPVANSYTVATDGILWRYQQTGHTYVWKMYGRTVIGSGFTTVYPGSTATWSSEIMRTVLDPQ